MATTLLRALDGEPVQLFNNGNTNKMALSVVSTTLNLTLNNESTPFMSISKGNVVFASDTSVDGNTIFLDNMNINGLLTLKGQANSGVTGMSSDVALSIEHTTAGGSSSILFKSTQDTTDYGYIKYNDTIGAAGTSTGQLIIGIENDGSNPDSLMLKGYTIINSDNISSDYNLITTFRAASVDKSYIDSNGDYFKGSTKVSYEGHTHTKSNITDFGTYDNYVKWILKANTETTGYDVTTGEIIDIKGSGATTVARSNGTITISSVDTDTNTASATDNILDGSNSGTAITYAPYAVQQAKLSLDTSTTAPTRTERLNLNGYFYATKVYSGSTELVNYTHPNHTGDVTSVADGATTIVTDTVTNVKLANMGVNTIKGRITAGTGDPEDLTATQVRTLLNVADGANNYSHPAINHIPADGIAGQILDWGSAGTAKWKTAGTTSQYLRGDGIWATPTDTNTTYAPGDGLALTSTTFSVGLIDGLEFDTSSPKKIRVKTHTGTNGTIGTINRSTNGIGVNLGTTGITACAGNDTRLSDSRTPSSHGDEAHNNFKSIRVTFPPNMRTYTWTHNMGSTNYIVSLTSNSPEAHLYYSDQLSNTLTINLDDEAYDQLNVDVLIIKLSSIATAIASA